MITPIRAMTINQLIARQDDLLVSVDDIKKLAENERAKTLDEVYAIALNESHDTLIEWLQDNIVD